MNESMLIGLSFLWSALYLAVLVFLLQRRSSGDRQVRLLGLYLLVWFVANLAQAIALLAKTPLWERVLPYGLILTTILLVNETRTAFSTRTVFGERFWWGVGAGWLALVILVDIFIQPAAWWIILVGWTFLHGRMALLLLRVIRKTTSGLARRQLYYWVLILGLSAVGGILALSGLSIWGNVAFWLGAILLSLVLTTPQMPDFMRVTGVVVGALLLGLIAAALYALFWTVISVYASSLQNTASWLVGLIISVGLALLFAPLWLLLQRWLSRIFPAPHLDITRILREYSLSVSNILDPQRLATAAIGLISEAIEIQRGILLLVYREQSGDARGKSVYRLVGTTGMGLQTPSDGMLGSDSVLAHHFVQARTPLFQHDLDFSPHFDQIPLDEQKWFADLHMDLYIPIYAKEEWIGLLALGSKAFGEPYTEADLLLLRILADQTSVALQNARLVESLMRVNNDFRRAYTALEQSNRQLGRVNTQLERLDRAKSDFIAIASHELRTPLTVMRGYTEMLFDDPLITGNQFYKKLVGGIYSGIMRFHEIVDGMLDIAMIDNRSLNLNVGDVSMEVLVRLIVNTLKDAAAARRLTLTSHNLQSLPPVAGDPEALRKVFYHLIINAIKYTPDGGVVTISGRYLSAQESPLSADAVEVTVSDTGIGIDPEYHDLIFAKFYQTGEIALHSTGKTKFKGGGPGLGLTIAKGIVEAHGGRIRVESSGYDEEKCPGSQFYVTLPLHRSKG